MGKTPLHKTHNRLDTLYFLLKLALVEVWLITDSFSIRFALLLTVCCVMCAGYMFHMPYYNQYLNHMVRADTNLNATKFAEMGGELIITYLSRDPLLTLPGLPRRWQPSSCRTLNNRQLQRWASWSQYM
jgi:hypothetical protein